MNLRHRLTRVAIAVAATLPCLSVPAALTRAADEDAAVPFQIPQGWTATRFAVEPQLGNPVAFCLDEQGRIFVAEEYRFNRGTEENRTRPFLLEDDLQLQTVDDRLAMFRKWADRFEGGMSWFSKYSDQVRLLEDRDGDGRADHSTVFAGGFNGPLDGLASGIIARDGDVYLTCIPNLWVLRDTDGDGRADDRKPLHRGFGVNASFLGHDLHGLVWGPDGRLYFSVGDRGFHVQTPEGPVLHGPGTGAVFRCEPDGSGLEVVARGLRNPQELAFDAHGNLFAVDNNCDKGDHSRLVFIVDGGDSGWNMAFQSLGDPYLTGPWHAERMWHLPHPGQPAWLLPPVGKLGAGPSGFVAYPGLGLPERYRDHFFYCNFTSNGGVESFAVRPKGAGFEVDDMHSVVSPVMATDVDFGYDGKMYISEFGKLEWDGSNNSGRIYAVWDPETLKNPEIRHVSTLFKEGFGRRSNEELVDLLRHPDMRVRLRAQFTLAGRGASSVARFAPVAAGSGETIPRLHAVWGLGQLGRSDPTALRPVLDRLGDSDPVVRAQAAKVLGEARYLAAADSLVRLLRDDNAQVRLRALLALGTLKYKAAVPAVLDVLAEDNGRDPFLRHAGVMALVGAADREALSKAAADDRLPARMAALLAMRRLRDARIAEFLNDREPSLVLEAARAINDLGIEAGTAPLARLIVRTSWPEGTELEPLLRRILNANFRLGGAEQARALVDFAADLSRPQRMREEALAALSDWEKPSNRDRVTGFWRPLSVRDASVVRAVLTEKGDRILNADGGWLEAQAIDLFRRYAVPVDGKIMLSLLEGSNNRPAVRIASLRLLAARRDALLDEALRVGLASRDASVRSEALTVLSSLDPGAAVARIREVLDENGASVQERQGALAILGSLKTAEADALLADWVGRLAAGRAPAELHLDIRDAAVSRGTEALRTALAAVDAGRSHDDPLMPYRPSLFGGDADRGKALFAGHAQAQCIRCHAVDKAGGTAGPDLAHVATRGDREYLLQSLIDPDAKIAAGFETVVLALRDGQVVTGVTKGEKDGMLILESPEGRAVAVPLDAIEERSPSRSAMPKMGDVLTARELRDVIAYLSTLK